MFIELSQSRLHNEEHFQHKRETLDILHKYPDVYSQLGAVGSSFASLIEEEDQSLETISKSDLTKQIADRDRERDEVTRGLFLHIEADTHHFDARLRAEAIGLQNIRNHYRGITGRNYDEQTAATHNLLQDLNPRHGTLTLLHLDGWVTRLMEVNEAVYELLRSRDAEKAEQPVTRIREVRALTDKALEAVYDALATFKRISANSTDTGKCIDELNAMNKRYADRLAQRAGQHAAAAQKGREKNGESGAE